MQLFEQIDLAQRQLDSALLDLRQKGIDSAETERVYRMAKSKKILELREQGTPTTLIPDLVKGDEEVAKLNFERNVADTTYKAVMEAINVKKLELRLLSMEYEREYTNECNR